MILDDKRQSEKFDYISGQHGGYYRHDFIDHAYLYNLYFPPEEVFNRFKNQIHDLVLNYPVGQDVLAELVGKIINQHPSRIVVGNGAAELIKIVSGHLAKKIIVPVPSFNEYVNAVPEGQFIEFPLQLPSFELDVEKFAHRIIESKADIAVVVTPNNPTSLAVPKEDLIYLTKKLAHHDCQLIIDESFIDFVEHPANATMESELEHYPNVTVFKSMSKAYGICGIRIGYMVTANHEFAATVRKGIPIWNINGFAEEFLRLLPDFQDQFVRSCTKVRHDRDLFYKALTTTVAGTFYKPDANYIFCRLPDSGPDGPDGPDVTRRLFIEHNMYIKHCQGKSMADGDRYIRIASRTENENTKLAAALRAIVGSQKG